MVLRETNKEEWLSVIYDNYSHALFGVIYRLIGDKALSEEILQSVFIKIWEKSELFDPAKGRLFTWMLQIARNTAIDFTRSKRYSQQKQTKTLEDHIERIQSEHQQETNINLIGLREFTDTLEEKQKEVIDLIYFQGYTQSEVAKALDMPLGTVKTKVRYALNVLRKAMLP